MSFARDITVFSRCNAKSKDIKAFSELIRFLSAETCWNHQKYNKTIVHSYGKLLYACTIIRFILCCLLLSLWFLFSCLRLLCWWYYSMMITVSILYVLLLYIMYNNISYMITYISFYTTVYTVYPYAISLYYTVLIYHICIWTVIYTGTSSLYSRTYNRYSLYIILPVICGGNRSVTEPDKEAKKKKRYISTAPVLLS